MNGISNGLMGWSNQLAVPVFSDQYLETQRSQMGLANLYPQQATAYWQNGTHTTGTKQTKNGIMNALKKYIEEHKGTIYTIGAIFLIDHFFLKGALRERITKITTNMLDKIQKTLEGA